MPGAGNIEFIFSEDGIEAAQKEFKARRSMIQSNRRYYRGEMPKPLEDDRSNVIINLCSDVVDQTVAFLLPDMPSLSLDDERDTSSDEAWLRGMWAQNGGATLLHEAAQNGSIGGQVYMRVNPPEPEQTGHEYPVLLVINPENVVTWWKDDNYRYIWGYELRWGDPTPNPSPNSGRGTGYDNLLSTNQERGYRQLVLKDGNGWVVRDYEGKGDKWTPTGEMLWSYPLPPVVDSVHLPKPNGYYGRGELTHKFLNDAVNAVASDMKSILRWHASPQLFGIGFEGQSLMPTSVDGMHVIEEKDARIQSVEMMSDLSSSMSMLVKLEALFYRQARVVSLPNDLAMFRGVTNLGIRTAFMPMISKNETLRRSYAKLIDRVSRVAMMLGNILPADAMNSETVKIEWGSALPTDDVAEVDLIQREMNMGILSKREAARLRGRDYDAVQRDLMEEAMLDGIRDTGMPIGVSG